ncbi:hypothetical protein F4820DRAFT_346682 [Hypoxylon rubiginosum]|uniref:Uncharacterized protein n=1 Tax=Hypoxylon rubiginosum TaxID=110542 RepID=A0ACB9YXW9_9PEZI|nr:hypothetical protein F4820DRAFT_346682 [Hypoxylon rubiginosum]
MTTLDLFWLLSLPPRLGIRSIRTFLTIYFIPQTNSRVWQSLPTTNPSQSVDLSYTRIKNDPTRVRRPDQGDAHHSDSAACKKCVLQSDLQ